MGPVDGTVTARKREEARTLLEKTEAGLATGGAGTGPRAALLIQGLSRGLCNISFRR